jgi:uncharacterized membrane protein YagU involved in acid resistance
MDAILRKVFRGATTGALATCTMTAALAAARFTGILGEPPPRKLTRRVLRLFGMNPGRGKTLDVVTALTHLGYGAACGALYMLLPRRARSIAGGAAYGAAIWAVSYMGWIPKVGLMPPPSFDRPGRPTAMILAHLVYGATLGAASNSPAVRLSTAPRLPRPA